MFEGKGDFEIKFLDVTNIFCKIELAMGEPFVQNLRDFYLLNKFKIFQNICNFLVVFEIYSEFYNNSLKFFKEILIFIQ